MGAEEPTSWAHGKAFQFQPIEQGLADRSCRQRVRRAWLPPPRLLRSAVPRGSPAERSVFARNAAPTRVGVSPTTDTRRVLRSRSKPW